MQIDPQINAERQAARKNRTLEQKYPLLHHAGIVHQVVERWTAAAPGTSRCVLRVMGSLA
jgi:hypothetical protein